MADCCHAAVQVDVTLPSGRPLSFCKHHYDKHEVTLAVEGAAVKQDRRGELIAREKARRNG